MKFTKAITILSLAAGIESSALPSTDKVTDSAIAKRSSLCKNPGAHWCAVLTSASLGSLGIQGSTVGSAGVTIVNGNCQSILTGGSLKTHSPGFSADFTTAYGTHLYYGASWIGLGAISGISFQYNGHGYTQKNCFTNKDNKFGFSAEAVQCNFPC